MKLSVFLRYDDNSTRDYVIQDSEVGFTDTLLSHVFTVPSGFTGARLFFAMKSSDGSTVSCEMNFGQVQVFDITGY